MSVSVGNHEARQTPGLDDPGTGGVAGTGVFSRRGKRGIRGKEEGEVKQGGKRTAQA